MKYSKLVRNKIPQIIKDRWATPIIHIANNNEYWESLKAKLLEETNEVLEDENINEELADVLEVIHAMLDFKGIDIDEIEKIRIKKKKERGWFNEKIILEEIKE